ncbi:TatD family hydrolase [Candidatus Phytoplasma melaleucae]|uniref:TatD family hydrolase n=1 Tax=Candidatus Phytoplasma melaleucae TaxID=2982630 RepID=A0ABT9DD87_9MOLU|nr:TatD family hydrolase ['Melaleuca sp.' phytoplasma]MDO8168032.1 TatD family hydrolase ['Melaleuca sp.' phytoplasma]MDV3205313.1 TatD family hydrolase [Weeping tea tree witches'-broom phytoplasma]
MLIDTHTHLNLDDYSRDLPIVIERALNNGISYFIVPGLDDKTNSKAIALSLKYPCIKAAIGIHPCYWKNEDPSSIEKYLKLKYSQVVAIGEIGLDLYHDKKFLHIQKQNLYIQLELSIKYNLPVILHARESFQEIYKMLLPYKNKIRGVFHCLTTSLEEVEKALELGFYIGVGGIITYQKFEESHKVLSKIPLDKILLETDSPFLTPSPLPRNKRNEPSFLHIIAEKVAMIKNISLEKVALQTSHNVKKIFLTDLL